jgi:hypothetical protein
MRLAWGLDQLSTVIEYDAFRSRPAPKWEPSFPARAPAARAIHLTVPRCDASRGKSGPLAGILRGIWFPSHKEGHALAGRLQHAPHEARALKCAIVQELRAPIMRRRLQTNA